MCSIAAALAMEVLGLTTTHTALTLWRYNTGKRKTDPSASVGLAVASEAAIPSPLQTTGCTSSTTRPATRASRLAALAGRTAARPAP